MELIKKRTITNVKNVYAEIILFEDGQRFIVSTNLHDETATTHIYNLIGFDEVGNHIYNPDGMRIGRSEETKVKNAFRSHLDSFLFKMGNNPARYNRIKEALKP